MSYCNTYAEVATFHKNAIKIGIRKVALDTLSLQNKLTKNQEILLKPRVQLLYIHHIFKDEAENFEKIVKYLASRYTFISHSEAVERILSDTIDKPYVAWSSDDGIWNNRIAADILYRYGASCCFYINPYSIELKDEQKRKLFCTEKLNMPLVKFLSWDDISRLQEQGHEIGNHTYDHALVTDLSIAEFSETFDKAHDIITAHCGTTTHFAYTYGRFDHFTKKAYDFVFERGYDSCTSAVRGCHINGEKILNKNQLFLRRDQIIGNWPLAHIEYFLIQSAKKAHFSSNFLPETY